LNAGYVAYRPATADEEVSYPPGTITSSDALLELARKGSGLFVEDSELLRGSAFRRRSGTGRSQSSTATSAAIFRRRTHFRGSDVIGRQLSIFSTRHAGQSTCETPPSRMTFDKQ
jgi:hypothetical protein